MKTNTIHPEEIINIIDRHIPVMSVVTHSNVLIDPAQIVGDSSVDPSVASPCTANTIGHHSHHRPSEGEI